MPVISADVAVRPETTAEDLLDVIRMVSGGAIELRDGGLESPDFEEDNVELALEE